jgi:acetyl-CoA carboxylase carboxyl transferase subunit beta
MLSWFRRPKYRSIERRDIPAGVWEKCPRCASTVYHRDLARNLNVCPNCGHHHRLSAEERISATIDEGAFLELDAGLTSGDPLRFDGYAAKLAESRAKTGNADAAITGLGTVLGWQTAIGALDFTFMGGSMGSVVGERIARIAERAVADRLPLIVFTASGGARMQEGALSLMQLAKTSAAIGRMREARCPYISVMCDPTTGGVTASFAFQGDVILAEPGAMIGFAGRRVIEQTIRRKLPENFQTAEFCLEHGLIDGVVQRAEMRETLARLLRFFGARRAAPPANALPVDAATDGAVPNSAAPDGPARDGAASGAALPSIDPVTIEETR